MANLDREPQTILPSSPSVGRQLRAAGGAGQSRTIDREPFPNEGNADLNLRQASRPRCWRRPIA